MLVNYAREKSEGEALTRVAPLPLTRDSLLSVLQLRALDPKQLADPAAGYPALWAAKGTLSRVYEQRHQRARAASTDPALAKMVADLADARRRRAELLTARSTKDPGTLKLREDDLKKYDARIAGLSAELSEKLPAVARADRLNDATLADFQKALPADAAVVDFYRYTFFEFDNTQPPGKKEKRTTRYAAFVVTRDRVAWADLDTAESVEKVVGLWREAVTAPPFTVPPDVPAKVRELLWEPVRKHLPAGVKVVYVCPEADLTRVPWAAIPGDKPGTILLEDHAVAAVPHLPFLLDMLLPPEAREDPAPGVLAVGGVAFGEPVKSPDPKALSWADLPGARAEADQVAKRAAGRGLDARVLASDAASADAVLAGLPRARYAHLATHGYFADPAVKSVLQPDPRDYERTWRGERIGRVANSPLVLSGLVLAGANKEGTPGRGIVTGEALVDRDLSGLELAVLSACETGLGDVAGGEGVYGLQRAFHYAGTRNVVASLWKVPDAATAALMGEFYRNLWERDLPPVEALRQAQLAVYRADPKQFAEMALRGPGLGDKDFDAKAAIAKVPVSPGGKNPPVVWAAWSLSGPGR